MRKFKLGLVAALAAVVLALSACTGAAPGAAVVAPRDISTPEKAKATSCSEIVAVTAVVDGLAASTAPGKRNQLRAWSLDPDNQAQIAATQTALDERETQCAATPSPTPAATTPSASPAASASVAPSPAATPATPAPTPAPTGTPVPEVGYVGWDQVVAHAPEGLKDAVNKYETTITVTEDAPFNWPNVQKWAKAKMKNGDEIDARIVLVFQQPDLSQADAREQAKVAADDVPVFYVTGCTDVNKNACAAVGTGTLVVLSSVKVKNGISVGLPVKQVADNRFTGSGAVAGTDQLILFEGEQVK